MKSINVALLHLDDARTNLTNTGLQPGYEVYKGKRYTRKLKKYLTLLLTGVQKIVLYGMFLYLPVYGALIYFKKYAVTSMFSLYYFVFYIVIIILFVMINPEEHTFRR